MFMKGFSLLELSLAIAIMAILMAGITLGGNILDNAKILGVVKQFKEVDLAMFNFKDKYGSYPGDFSDAYRYFSAEDDKICGDKNQCNGDDDGYIEVGAKRSSEVYRLWQHLALGKFIKGDYSGVWGESPYYMQGGFSANITVKNEDKYGNVIKFGSFVNMSGGTSDGGVFYPHIAEKLDQKLDDKNPIRGQVRGGHGFLGGDADDLASYDSNCYDDVEYKVSYDNSKACNLIFILN